MGCVKTCAMKVAFPISLASNSPADTETLARSVAPLLVSGDTLLLNGEIGAGKTLFARSLIQARLAMDGNAEHVPSPTYTLVQTYQDADTEIWHADLYRLADAADVMELGLQDAFRDAICLVEWPDRLGNLKPQSALNIDFEIGATEGWRRLTFAASDPRWAKLLPVLQAGVAD